MDTQPRFSFVIVTYENQETIESCLESIAQRVRGSYEITVVDNSPGDETRRVMEGFRRRNGEVRFQVIVPPTNVGFARACNFGVTKSTGEYVFLLNPDTRLENDAAAELAACLESHPDAGAAGPAILGTDGTTTRTCRNLPTLPRILVEAVGLDNWLGIYKLPRSSHNSARTVEQIMGAAMLIRRADYLALSGMDERFFMYFDEVDFCKRLAEAGKTVWFWPEARVTHRHGTSSGTSAMRARMIYALRESREKYFRRHFSPLVAFGLRVVNRFEGILKWAASLVLFAFTRDRRHLERATGFWFVATRSDPSRKPGTHRVLAFTVKPENAPDTRYRILQYRRWLEEQDICIQHHSLLPSRFFTWHIRGTRQALRALWYPFLVVRRLVQVLTQVPQYDTVWISREMAPIGPAILERLVFRRAKHVVLDIDDALHVADGASKSFIHRYFRDFSKYTGLAARYSAIVCGSHFLADYFKQWSNHVHVIPTVVDTRLYRGLSPVPSSKVRIGWVGTPTNLHHLEWVKPALLELARRRPFEFVVVGLNRPLDWNLPGLRCLEWKLSTELSYFSAFDIGVMPLDNFEFAKGKSALKLIQYMAAGLPVVASPVGANEEIVIHGVNGFLPKSQEDWVQALTLLIDDAELRERFGRAGRQAALEHYSLDRYCSNYAALLKGHANGEAVSQC